MKTPNKVLLLLKTSYLLFDHIYGNLIPPSNLQVSPVAQGFFTIPSTAKANYFELPSLPRGVLFIIPSKNF